MKELNLLLIMRDPFQYPDAKDNLLALGHFVNVAYGAADGYIATLRYRPDAVILDAHADRINGHRLVTYLKQDPRLNDTPVISMSERYSPKECCNKLDAGSDDYLADPFDAAVLVARIRACLDVRFNKMPLGIRRKKHLLDKLSHVFYFPRHGSNKYAKR